jgi:hypothetical protein
MPPGENTFRERSRRVFFYAPGLKNLALAFYGTGPYIFGSDGSGNFGLTIFARR